ncbi:MAG TPA: methyltransferase [Vicinamibacterales bacterium]|jgi:SAM-dependent methyltransferase|nr:methyltransferase [Vicinamibacterales bacterium]
MRYGIKPANPAEWLALKLHKIPLPIIDTLLPIVQARALIAANNAGVLRRLASGGATASELATGLSLDEHCLSMVLRVLESMGYVQRSGATWSLTDLGLRHFGARAAESYEAFVEYCMAQWTFVEQLDEVLRTGKGIDFHEHQTEAEWSAYQRAMFENAKGFAWFVVGNTPVPAGATSCLDLAGSHGYVGAMLCEKHPPMRSTVIDRPDALTTARPIGEQEPWGRLVSYREGDLLTADFGTGHDVALLANILHHFPAETKVSMLRKVREALKPGGTVSIFEIEAPRDDQPTEAAGDGLALYFRITSTSACYRGDDYVAWLTAAGFQAARVVRSFRMPSRMLIVATA